MTQIPADAPLVSKIVRYGAHGLIRTYQLTLSSIMGRQCRYLPTCSEYVDESIQRHGFWTGGWMGLARVCRCRPGGSSGYDPVPEPRAEGRALTPWRYGDWRGPRQCEGVE